MENETVFATIITDDNETMLQIEKMTGAHFYNDFDPQNKDNKVLKVVVKNTSYTLSNSTTKIIAKRTSPQSTVAELEFEFFFHTITWLYNSRFFSLDLRNKADVSLFSLLFEASERNENGCCSKLFLKKDDGSLIDNLVLHSERWYKLKFEYYPNAEKPQKSRLKIFCCERGKSQKLVSDISAPGKIGVISKVALVHNAKKIRGIHYLDNISFAVTDKKYSAASVYEPIPGNIRKIHDFENGIPSNSDFNIEMTLNVDSEFFTFDPAYLGTNNNTSFLHSSNNYDILLVLAGECTLFAKQNEYHLSTGSIAITPPGYAKGLITKTGYKIISVTGNFERLSFLNGVCLLKDNIYNEGKKIAQMILYNRFGNEDYLNSLCDTYVKYILFNLDRPPVQNTTESIYKIIEEMERRFGTSDLNVGELLDKSGYARNYIRGQFSVLTKMTPTQYLSNIRMRNAKAMIDQYGDNISISEIAERCGILDLSVFSRIFKKYYGLSPKKYKSSSNETQLNEEQNKNKF